MWICGHLWLTTASEADRTNSAIVCIDRVHKVSVYVAANFQKLVSLSFSVAFVCREQKCFDTIGTVLVPWAGRFQC